VQRAHLRLSLCGSSGLRVSRLSHFGSHSQLRDDIYYAIESIVDVPAARIAVARLYFAARYLHNIHTNCIIIPACFTQAETRAKSIVYAST